MRPFLNRLCLPFVLLLALPAAAQTTCAGRDLMADLSPAERASLDQATAAAPFPTGNHWHAEKAGAVIDLIGTFHLDDARMKAPMTRLAPLIDRADAVYLEATEVEVAQLQKAIATNPDLLFTKGPTLPERLSETEWQDLSAAMNARGIPPFLASKFKPWYVSVLLGLPPCAMSALTGGGANGLDKRIEAEARKAARPTLPLEPFDTIFRAVDRFSPEEQLDMIRAGLPQAAQSEDLLATMTASYFRETHREIWAFARLLTLKTPGTDPARADHDLALTEEALITSRNRAWLEVLRTAAPGKRLVVAVGAGHLSGESGLLNLLEQDGWNLTRQAF
ncbi:MAG: TraB/GumN family protein [Rhodobacteraceae bacterium]|nr:TraB/GumN family protein [Paracoccaceae bacterium]